MKRYHSLDYLRGLAAFAIMYYHYSTWTFGVYSSNSFLGRIGLYGVSIFYVLSGLTLFLIYYNKEDKFLSFTKYFFIKRAFRIMPLLWLAVIATLLLKREETYSNFVLFLNLSGLFGIVDCNVSIARGGWSIGNEIAFYLFFPFFILFSKNFKIAFYLLITFILCLFLWFAFFYIKSNSTIENEWFKYINPLNQVLLFLAGYLIGYFYRDRIISDKLNLLLITFAILAFLFYPVVGERIELITEYNRVIFTLLSITICFSFYKFSGELSSFIHKPLSALGEMSYSLYLLHPIVWAFFEKLLKYLKLDFPAWVNMIICIPCSLIASFVIYNSFEKYFMKIGKNLSMNKVIGVKAGL